jgi:hypothetical protein
MTMLCTSRRTTTTTRGRENKINPLCRHHVLRPTVVHRLTGDCADLLRRHLPWESVKGVKGVKDILLDSDLGFQPENVKNALDEMELVRSDRFYLGYGWEETAMP